VPSATFCGGASWGLGWLGGARGEVRVEAASVAEAPEDARLL
jgi:hypothetical protein